MSEFYTAAKWLSIVVPFAEEAFLTGSRAFGTARDPKEPVPVPMGPDGLPLFGDPEKTLPPSDTDIAVLVSSLSNVQKSLEILFPCTSKPSSYNAGVKFETQHGTLNIVPLHPLDFVCWKLTTTHIKNLVVLCPETKDRIKLREIKLGIFEALTGIHKTLIPYTGCEDALELAERIKIQ